MSRACPVARLARFSVLKLSWCYMKKRHDYEEIGSSAHAHCVIRSHFAGLVPWAGPASVITWKISSPVSRDLGIIPAKTNKRRGASVKRNKNQLCDHMINEPARFM